MTTTVTTPKELIREAFEQVWNRDNMEFITAAFLPTFVACVPRRPFQDLDAYRRYVLELHEAFPDIHFEIDDQIAEGDEVVTRWTMTGTHEGDLMGIPPTGRQVIVEGITISRLSRNRIAESWTEWDCIGLLHQIGVIPEVV